MYGKRLKILLALCSIIALLCITRLGQMQLLSRSWYRARISELQQSTVKRLPATRGSILDRNGRVLAADELSFDLCMTYSLSSAYDRRATALGEKAVILAQENRAHFDAVMEKCARIFGADVAEIRAKVQARNDSIWSVRLFQAWRDACPDSDLLRSSDPEAIPLQDAMADFRRHVPDLARQEELARRIDIAEMHENWPFLQLRTPDDLLAAQLEFTDMEGIDIAPHVTRTYPYGKSAAQIIGWVGPASERYQLPLEDSEFRSYAAGELCGRAGVEYVCEALLRGRRGQRTYDFDRNIVNEVERMPGANVTLTLDIELQKSIEQLVRDPARNPNWQSPTAVVIIDAVSGDILALVSEPSYDLMSIRQDYTKVRDEPNMPLLSRTLECLYPPGSVVKPIILIAGMESGAITKGEVISCPSRSAPAGWPSCWIWRQFRVGHDTMWSNYSVNAIKGSCNIYFSRLADRLDRNVLQKWLLKFGYGTRVLARQNMAENSPAASEVPALPPRYMPEQPGIVDSGDPAAARDAGPLPPIADNEKKMFGIGQGSLRVTPIEVAAAMAAISRHGIYESPRLFVRYSDTSGDIRDLGISGQTIDTIRAGMYGVVNEEGGTANKAFRSSYFHTQGVSVFGKTGSTQAPEHAWFGGFAEDRAGRALAIAVVIEGGQSGGSDASPLARDILALCMEAGYVGPRTTGAD